MANFNLPFNPPVKHSQTLLRTALLALALTGAYLLGRWHGRPQPAPSTAGGDPAIRALVERAAERSLPLPTLDPPALAEGAEPSARPDPPTGTAAPGP